MRSAQVEYIVPSRNAMLGFTWGRERQPALSRAFQMFTSVVAPDHRYAEPMNPPDLIQFVLVKFPGRTPSRPTTGITRLIEQRVVVPVAAAFLGRRNSLRRVQNSSPPLRPSCRMACGQTRNGVDSALSVMSFLPENVSVLWPAGETTPMPVITPLLVE